MPPAGLRPKAPPARPKKTVPCWTGTATGRPSRARGPGPAARGPTWGYLLGTTSRARPPTWVRRTQVLPILDPFESPFTGLILSPIPIVIAGSIPDSVPGPGWSPILGSIPVPIPVRVPGPEPVPIPSSVPGPVLGSIPGLVAGPFMAGERRKPTLGPRTAIRPTGPAARLPAGWATLPSPSSTTRPGRLSPGRSRRKPPPETLAAHRGCPLRTIRLKVRRGAGR